MFSSVLILLTILLLLIGMNVYGLEVARPPLCRCHRNVSDPVGSNYPCDSPGCSRGNNIDCSADSFTGPYPFHRVFDFWGITVIGPYAYFGCNCPAFSYNHGQNGSNGYLVCFSPGENQDENEHNYKSNSFNYTSCSDFDTEDFHLSDCCYYCCGNGQQYD